MEFNLIQQIVCGTALCMGVVIWALKPFWQRKGPNPFVRDAKEDTIIPTEQDPEKRDKVLKKLYTKANVPEEDSERDAIVIGSGIGGLALAAVMARAGKKVTVLEQHDVAGGCCHTFFEQDFEFDCGIHYIGVPPGSNMRLVCDRLTDKQLQWEALDEEYDIAFIGDRRHAVKTGKKAYRDELVKQFPNDAKAIDTYFEHIKTIRKGGPFSLLVKIVPRWFVDVLIKSGVLGAISGSYFRLATMTSAQVIDELTDNAELKAVLTYLSGDFGCLPSEGSFAMHAGVVDHYINGAYYPKGGASEIVYQFIKQVNKTGGDVFVKGLVKEVVVEGGKAVGVRMDKDDRVIRAPIVISDAGYLNTYTKLCPQLSYMADNVPITSGASCACLFVGLEGSKEKLELEAKNFWTVKPDEVMKKLDNMEMDEILKGDWELAGSFVSFPSAKDSLARERCPDKSTCSIVAFLPFKWFQGWETEQVHHRGTDYEVLKQVISDKLWKEALKVKPHLKDHVEHMEGATPITHKFYLNTPKGEIYGLGHEARRYTPEVMATMRPETPIKGLFLTGQDVLCCGFGGALMGAMFSACVVLERNLMLDIPALKKEYNAEQLASKKAN